MATIPQKTRTIRVRDGEKKLLFTVLQRGVECRITPGPSNELRLSWTSDGSGWSSWEPGMEREETACKTITVTASPR